ncbi:MAG: restriction endonuclease subunit S [Ruminococcaceae bacterium]|mgnify:CR=1 FL=1|nr:restriction endonuclease subunit S [Oscillospiraceae bacterium]
MSLIKYKLGKLIESSNLRNSDRNNKYSAEDVRGISTGKEFIETKANLKNVSLSPYKIVDPENFAYVADTSRRGDKISLAFNDSEKTIIVSSISTVFNVRRKDLLDPYYLFMYFNRSEFDRFSRYNSWGSARETFSWEDFCDIEIELPLLSVQKKYVAVYEALLANQKAYEEGLEDLKLISTAFIEHLRKEGNLKSIGDYIRPFNEKNTDGKITLEQGINIEKKFITPQRSNSNLKGRKIVRKGQFAYCTQLNNENVAIAYRSGEDCVVSSVYDVFEIEDSSKLLPEYLMLWLIRPEFGRYVYWASEGSAYEFLSYESIAEYMIPVPSIAIQRSVGNIYLSYVARRSINEKLKTKLKNLCPILIKGAVEEASRKEILQ